MKELQIIDQRVVLGKEFRIFGTPEEPLFLARDVASWIGYSNSNTSKLVNMVDEHEKTTRKYVTTGSSYQTEAWFLTEEGVYEILMRSRKPIAKQFKDKVKEILKDIRKYGIYATDETIEKMLGDPDTMIKVLGHYKAEKEKREYLEQIVEAQRPKVLFAKAVELSDSCILMDGLAKLIKQNGIDIGSHRLFRWMRENGFLIRKQCDSYNAPTQKAMNQGLLELRKYKRTCRDGSVIVKNTPMITPKGQQYFLNLFLGQQKGKERKYEKSH